MVHSQSPDLIRFCLVLVVVRLSLHMLHMNTDNVRVYLASFPGRFFTNRTPGEKYGLVLIVFGRVCRDRKIHCKTSRKITNQSTQCSQMKMTSPLASYVLEHSSNTREQVQRISVLPGRLGRLLICQYMVVPGGLH